MFILNEYFYKLSVVKCFLLVDVKDGFFYILFDEELLWMIIMYILYGRYRWFCLFFGIISVFEEF